MKQATQGPGCECKDIPGGYDRSQKVLIQSRTPKAYDQLIHQNYWRLVMSQPKLQQPKTSDYVVGVLRIVCELYGQAEVERVCAAPVERMKVIGGKDMLEDAAELVAEHFWAASSDPKRSKRHDRILAQYCGSGHPSLSPHLAAIKNCAGNHKLFIISQVRTGGLAFGSTIDDRFPPEAKGHHSFCPCCKETVADTIAHHLLGQCKPEWAEDYAAATSDEQKAALLLAVADGEYEDPISATLVAGQLSEWLDNIVDVHPREGKLSAEELEVLAFRISDSDEALQAAVTRNANFNQAIRSKNGRNSSTATRNSQGSRGRNSK